MVAIPKNQPQPSLPCDAKYPAIMTQVRAKMFVPRFNRRFFIFYAVIINMNLIVAAALCEPPSDFLVYRFLTQFVKTNFHSDVLLESPKEMIDIYYHYLKSRGGFDYVSDILPAFTSERGIRLDTEPNFPQTIVVQAVRFENVHNILGQLKLLNKIN